MIVLSFSLRAESALFTVSDSRNLGHVVAFIAPITTEGRGVEIGHSILSDKYFIFPNLEPGTYQITRVVQPTPHGKLTPAVFTFSPHEVKQTTIMVKAGEVAFMGEFGGSSRVPILETTPIEAWGAFGRRTRNAEREALQYIKQTFPESAWAGRIR